MGLGLVSWSDAILSLGLGADDEDGGLGLMAGAGLTVWILGMAPDRRPGLGPPWWWSEEDLALGTDDGLGLGAAAEEEEEGAAGLDGGLLELEPGLTPLLPLSLRWLL